MNGEVTKTFKDASGGLNDRDLPSNLAANEFAQYDGWYGDEGGFPGKKIPGAKIIQSAPIDPKLCVNDGNTMGYWKLDDAGFPLVDASGNTNNFLFVGTSGSQPTRTVGVLPVGGPLAYLFGNAATDSWTANTKAVWVNYLDGKNACTFDLWFRIDEDFTGVPFITEDTPTGSGTEPATRSNDNSGLLFTGEAATPFENIANGLTCHIDTNAGKTANLSGPYVKFRLQTNGIADTVTVIQTNSLPKSTSLHVRGTYDGTSGLMILKVNGNIHAEVIVAGAGTIKDDTIAGSAVPITIVSLGQKANKVVFGPVAFYHEFKGFIDDACISDVVRVGVPFEKPRGNPMEYVKSDGTAQILAVAGDGIYFTVGDASWTNIVSGLSTTAFWDHKMVGDVMYLCNGIDQPSTWDGVTYRDWGNPTVAPTVAIFAGGTVDAGSHDWAYTYEFGDEETGPSPRKTVVLGAPSDMDITLIPTRAANCTAIKLYRTIAAGSELFFYRRIPNNPLVSTVGITGAYVAGTPAGPDTDTGGDGVTDANIVVAPFVEMEAEVQTSVTPNPQFITDNYERLFVAGDLNERYAVRYTLTFFPDIFRLLSVINATHFRGPVTALSKSTGEVHAHKGGRACLVLRGSRESSWRVFEDLHPSIGAIDHFSIVYRTIRSGGNDTDETIMCFAAPDGFYAYRGYQFKRIDDIIDKTFKNLKISQVNTRDYLTTTLTQWQAQKSLGGSTAPDATTQNVQEDTYNTDGLRGVSGDAKILNQLEWLGLWHNVLGQFPVNVTSGGKNIAIAKGPLEGEFFFSMDNDSKLYRTLDNFVTAAVVANLTGVTGLDANDRIIEIVPAVIGGQDTYWIFYSDATDEGGVARWDQTAGSWNNGAAPYTTGHFWQADIPIDVNIETAPSQFFLGIASNGAQNPPFNRNIYINHQQDVTFVSSNAVQNGSFGFANGYIIQTSASQTAAAVGAVVATADNVNTQTDNIASGFYSVYFDFLISAEVSWRYTRRETSAWQGGDDGTFRPQAFWDPTSAKLIFSSGSAENGAGNRSGQVNRISGAGAYALLDSTTGYRAICFDAVNDVIYATHQVHNSNQLKNFDTRAKDIDIATEVVSNDHLYATETLVLRMSWEPDQTEDNFIINLVKDFTNGIFLTDQYRYQGRISRSVASTGTTPVYFKDFIGDSATAPFPKEIVLQADDPNFHYVAIDRLSSGEPQAVYGVVGSTEDPTSSVIKADGFDAETVGIQSNLIYVSQSGAAGGDLWANRLYFGATRDFGLDGTVDDCKPVQLGVPGNWIVIGKYKGEEKNLGAFDAYGNFETDFDNQDPVNSTVFFLANAALAANLPASEVIVTPNAKITDFPSPAILTQFRIVMTWVYTLANPTTSPKVEFINIGNIVGDADIPRVSGIHFDGRTRWTVSEVGKTGSNMEIIYQKNNTWTTARKRNIEGYGFFRQQLVAFDGYNFIRLEFGKNYLGARINTFALTGSMQDEPTDKYIRDLQVNLMESQNPDLVGETGYLKVVPYGGGIRLAQEWKVPIPITGGERLPKQVQAVQGDTFVISWARVLQIAIFTSDDPADGDFPALTDQEERILSLIIKFRVSQERHKITVA